MAEEDAILRLDVDASALKANAAGASQDIQILAGALSSLATTSASSLKEIVAGFDDMHRAVKSAAGESMTNLEGMRDDIDSLTRSVRELNAPLEDIASAIRKGVNKETSVFRDEIGKLSQQLDAFTTAATKSAGAQRQVNQETEKGILSQIQSAKQLIGTTLATVGLTGAFTGLSSAIISENAQFETAGVRLEALMGTTLGVKAHLEDMRLGITEPIDVHSLDDAREKLAEVGITGEKSLLRITHVSEDTGRSIETLAGLLERVKVSGASGASVTRQLRSIGISQQELIENGAMTHGGKLYADPGDAASTKALMDALLKSMERLGQSGAVADTIAGKWTILQNNLKLLADQAGQASSGPLKSLLDDGIAIEKAFSGVVEPITKVSLSLGSMAATGIAAGAAMAFLPGLIAAAGTALAGFATTATAFLFANPLVLAAAAAAVAVQMLANDMQREYDIQKAIEEQTIKSANAMQADANAWHKVRDAINETTDAKHQYIDSNNMDENQDNIDKNLLNMSPQRGIDIMKKLHLENIEELRDAQDKAQEKLSTFKEPKSGWDPNSSDYQEYLKLTNLIEVYHRLDQAVGPYADDLENVMKKAKGLDEAFSWEKQVSGAENFGHAIEEQQKVIDKMAQTAKDNRISLNPKDVEAYFAGDNRDTTTDKFYQEWGKEHDRQRAEQQKLIEKYDKETGRSLHGSDHAISTSDKNNIQSIQTDLDLEVAAVRTAADKELQIHGLTQDQIVDIHEKTEAKLEAIEDTRQAKIEAAATKELASEEKKLSAKLRLNERHAGTVNKDYLPGELEDLDNEVKAVHAAADKERQIHGLTQDQIVDIHETAAARLEAIEDERVARVEAAAKREIAAKDKTLGIELHKEDRAMGTVDKDNLPAQEGRLDREKALVESAKADELKIVQDNIDSQETAVRAAEQKRIAAAGGDQAKLQAIFTDTRQQIEGIERRHAETIESINEGMNAKLESIEDARVAKREAQQQRDMAIQEKALASFDKMEKLKLKDDEKSNASPQQLATDVQDGLNLQLQTIELRSQKEIAAHEDEKSVALEAEAAKWEVYQQTGDLLDQLIAKQEKAGQHDQFSKIMGATDTAKFLNEDTESRWYGKGSGLSGGFSLSMGGGQSSALTELRDQLKSPAGVLSSAGMELKEAARALSLAAQSQAVGSGPQSLPSSAEQPFIGSGGVVPISSGPSAIEQGLIDSRKSQGQGDVHIEVHNTLDGSPAASGSDLDQKTLSYANDIYYAHTGNKLLNPQDAGIGMG